MIINVEKKTGVIVDINQHYDERFFENKEVPDDTISKASFSPGKYTVDTVSGEVVKINNAGPVSVSHVLIKKDQSYGVPHTHRGIQLLVVLAGSISVGDKVVNANETLTIPEGTEHVLTGVADVSLLVTLIIF